MSGPDPRSAAQLAIIESPVREGDIWRHRNGTLYQIVGFAVDEATMMPMVLYRPCPVDGAWSIPFVPWSRPLSVFLQRDPDGYHKFTLHTRPAVGHLVDDES